MQDLLKLILKYSNLLMFIILEIAAFMLLILQNDYPHATALSTANSLVAKQYETEERIVGYFSLSQRNEELSRENAQLREQMEALRQMADDSVARQFAELEQGFRYIPARVVLAERRMSHNYLTINRGKNHGVRTGMGVRNQDGVVGIVCSTGENYSLVIPIIHTRSKISTMIAGNEYMGTLTWPGNSDHYASLEDIAIHVNVQAGDTLVSSGLTYAFPRGIPVGVVDECHIKEGSSYYTICVRLSVNFRSLNYVQVIDNRAEKELKQLLHGVD